MASTAAAVLTRVVWLTWSCLSLTAAKLKNPAYAMVLATQVMLEELLSDSLVVFAPSLLDILQAKSPPTLSQLKALPTNAENRWGVYLLVLEKPHQGSQHYRPKIYIGSGTKFAGGVFTRFRQYDTKVVLPFYLKRALDDGYEITHKGLLCWSPIPVIGRIYLVRVLLLALESMFSITLWAMVSRTKDYNMPHICPWKLEDLEYDGLCSHVALIEGIKGEENGLTPEQIAAKELEQFRDWDITKRNRCKAAKTKAIKERSYACNICNFAFNSTYDLSNHNRTQRHINKAGGITKVLKNPDQMVWQQKNRDAKVNHCEICDHSFGTSQQLTVHLNSKRHKNKAAAALSKSSSSST